MNYHRTFEGILKESANSICDIISRKLFDYYNNIILDNNKEGIFNREDDYIFHTRIKGCNGNYSTSEGNEEKIIAYSMELMKLSYLVKMKNPYFLMKEHNLEDMKMKIIVYLIVIVIYYLKQ